MRRHDRTFRPDFLQCDGNLVIEIDGSIHERQWKKKHDKERREALNRGGLYVLKFWNGTVIKKKNYYRIVAVIDKRLRQRPNQSMKLTAGNLAINS